MSDEERQAEMSAEDNAREDAYDDGTERAAANGERHVLLGDPEALVEVNGDGSVAVTIDGTAYLSVQRLGEIVAFVEAHGQCQVVERDA